jgi:tetratricopeptide (TPR) repeat protein
LALSLIAILVACGQSGQDGDAPTAAKKVPVTTSSAEALELYLQGQALFDDLHFVDAQARFLEAVAVDDSFAMGYFMAAQTAQTTAEFFDAIGKADELAGNASDGEQLYIKALVAAGENDDARQRAALEELVALYPGDERTHFQLANFLTGQQDFAAAAEHYQHATEIAPDFAGAFNALGYAQRSLEDFAAARTAFEKYVELIPDEANPYDSLAELLMEMGEYDESIANYRKALQINRNFPCSYAGISINYSLKGQPELAQEAAEDMLAAARNFTERQAALYQSTAAHLYARDIDAAMKVCEMIMGEAVVAGNHSSMGNVAEYMGDIMLASGDAAKAEEYYDAALDHRLQANLNEANKAQAARAHLFKTAIAAMVGGDSDAAASRTAEYIAAAEAQGTAFEKLRIHELSGFLAMNQEDNEAAAMHFAKSSQLQPIPLYWAAWVNKELGRLDTARELADRAANRNTLSLNLPLFRADAAALLAELSGA